MACACRLSLLSLAISILTELIPYGSVPPTYVFPGWHARDRRSGKPRRRRISASRPNPGTAAHSQPAGDSSAGSPRPEPDLPRCRQMSLDGSLESKHRRGFPPSTPCLPVYCSPSGPACWSRFVVVRSSCRLARLVVECRHHVRAIGNGDRRRLLLAIMDVSQRRRAAWFARSDVGNQIIAILHGRPSMLTMMSPAFSPALAAGNPGWTELMMTPFLKP